MNTPFMKLTKINELVEAKMRFAETEKQLNVLEEELDRLEADVDALTWEIEDTHDNLVVCAEAVDAAEEELEA